MHTYIYNKNTNKNNESCIHTTKIIADDPEQFERYMNTGQSSAPTSIYKYKMSIVTIN